MKIAICDDEKVELELISKYCKEWSKGIGEVCKIDVFTSAEEFLFKYEDVKDYDVLFLDIQMKELNGMELAKRLRKLGEEVVIVFITGDREYVFQGYEVQALDYIVKPVEKEKLFKAFNRVSEHSKKEYDYLFANCDGVTYKIKQLDICCIESIGHETILHMIDKKIVCKKGISFIEKEVNEEYFYRCHRSYIVNISKIDSISKKEIIVEGGLNIPIARGRWEGLNKSYLNFYRGVICQ